MSVCMCMSKSLNTWINEIKESLRSKGYKKDIPLDIFKAEFMILSGYSRKKVIEWTDNFNICKLIKISNDKVNWNQEFK